MNISKLNIYAYRTIGLLICLFLMTGAWGMLDKHENNKAYVGIIACILIAALQFRRPSLISWALLIVILLTAMFVVGFIHGTT
jgi:hypothetical protein